MLVIYNVNLISQIKSEMNRRQKIQLKFLPFDEYLDIKLFLLKITVIIRLLGNRVKRSENAIFENILPVRNCENMITFRNFNIQED